MGAPKNTFDLQAAMEWCFTIQRERICRALMYEATSLKLLPDLHRELLTLARLAKLISSNLQHPGSSPSGARSSEEPPSPTAVREEIMKLNPEDRRLLRKAMEELGSQLGQLNSKKEVGETNNLKERINDQKKSSD
jgi:hypothetical protein